MELDLTLPAFTLLATALLIDDDEDFVYLLRLLLLRDGRIVHTPTKGRDAKEFMWLSTICSILAVTLVQPRTIEFSDCVQLRLGTMLRRNVQYFHNRAFTVY